MSDILDRQARRKLILATFASLVLSVVDAAAVALVLPLIELSAGTIRTSTLLDLISRFAGTTNVQELTRFVVIWLVGLFIAKDLASMALHWWNLGFNFRQRLRLAARLLRHFLTSPYTEVTRRSSSELIRTMNDAVGNAFNFSLAGALTALTSSISILAIVVGLLVLAPLPTLFLVGYFSLAAYAYLQFVKPRALAAGRVMTDASERAWHHALAALFGLRELQLRGSQETFIARYMTVSETGWRAARVAVFLGSLPRHLLEILFILAVGVVIVFTSNQGGSGSTVGLLALFVAAGFRILPSVTSLLGSLSQVRVGSASLEVVRAEVAAARAAERLRLTPVVEPPLDLSRELRVENVTFRYPTSDTDVLRDVTLALPFGATLAIVGASGEGKTTLADLILGLHAPISGRVVADDVDIAAAPRQWRENLAYVPQDVFLLDATLAENVAFDVERAQIDEARLNAALAQAQLGDLVSSLPLGVDTRVGERGVLFSGGQRQRIGIARALYRRPRLLVLDEATSALDAETEHRITAALDDLHGHLSIIVIAHRLSTVRGADQVAFMKGGRIDAVGTFEELRRLHVDFGRLVDLGRLEPDQGETAS
jgi:ABC-type multidrug transport system fused ATPase/permease subunit